MKPAALDLTREEWTAAGLAIIENHPPGEHVYADKLRVLIPEPHQSHDWGGLFSAAKAAGLVTHVGWRRSTHPTRRNGTQAVWERIERKHRP